MVMTCLLCEFKKFGLPLDGGIINGLQEQNERGEKWVKEGDEWLKLKGSQCIFFIIVNDKYSNNWSISIDSS